MTEIWTTEVPYREVVRIEIASPLARLLAGAGAKPRGLRRLRLKLAKQAFHLLHQRWGIQAPARVSLANGRAFTVDCANTAYIELSQRLARSGSYEPEVSMLLDLLAPGLRRVIDIGANWGFLTLLIAMAPGFTGQIDAFEIHPKTYLDLERAVDGAGLKDIVTCHGVGLSDRDGEVRLSRERHSFLTRVLGDGDGGAGVPASVRRLDALGLGAPDLIKIDVEGHEAAVLRGGENLIPTALPYLILESWYAPTAVEAMLEPLHLLETWGFTLFCVDSVGSRLELTPISAESRTGIGETLNLLAVPPSRRAALASLFTISEMGMTA